jgi:hypothetical protein
VIRKNGFLTHDLEDTRTQICPVVRRPYGLGCCKPYPEWSNFDSNTMSWFTVAEGGAIFPDDYPRDPPLGEGGGAPPPPPSPPNPPAPKTPSAGPAPDSSTPP